MYEIEEFVWEWKAFEEICLDPAYSVEEILVSGETDKVRVERYDIKTDDLAAFPVLGSFDHPHAIPAA